MHSPFHSLPFFLPAALLLNLTPPAAAQSTADAASGIGAQVFAEDFDTGENPLEQWSPGGGGGTAELLASTELPAKGKVLQIQVPPGPLASQVVTHPLNLDTLRGKRISFRALIKAQDVAKPPKLWNGIKLMLYTNSPTAGEQYEAATNLHGSFEWVNIGFMAAVPADITDAKLFLGLEETTGTVWFDKVEAEVAAIAREIPATRKPLPPPDQLDRRTEIPRLRGVMYGPKGKEEDLRQLAAWGANHIRWQFYWHPGNLPGEGRYNLKAYDAWLKETALEVKDILPLCEELGISVVIDLHTPPGGGKAGQWLLFEHEMYQKYFINAWDRLAKQFKDEPAVWGYDLVNEPSEGAIAPGLMGWRELAEHVAKRVRAIDPHKAIIVEPGQHGGWSNLPYFPPLDVPGVVYSVHVYDPLEFTHQGILDGYPDGVTYPGEINGKHWDRDALRAHLQAVRDYQLDYGVPIYIGEFSAPRWAPGESSAAYLRDCIAIFEEFGWDWAYHSYREWHGWNVEIVDGKGENDPRAATGQTTERKKALLDGFSANKEP